VAGDEVPGLGRVARAGVDDAAEGLILFEAGLEDAALGRGEFEIDEAVVVEELLYGAEIDSDDPLAAERSDVVEGDAVAARWDDCHAASSFSMRRVTLRRCSGWFAAIQIVGNPAA